MNIPSSAVSTPAIDRALSHGAAIAIGVSGGKDSQAAALATVQYLNRVGHSGPRILIHADLGMVEWSESLPLCEELARYLVLDLVVVRRKAGGLMERWEQRWESNKRRYANMETMRVVLPWSTPTMRFCTSELKSAPVASELRRRFPDLPIINVTGIRAQESAARSKQPIANLDEKLSRPDRPLLHWRPILRWTTEEVFAAIASTPLTPHRAYTALGSTRVSCRFCILASQHDLHASIADPASHDLLRRMAQLEIDSSFAFQGGRWLADLAPHLLTPAQRAGVARAKDNAELRKHLENEIPSDLRFDGRRLSRMPTVNEAITIAHARTMISKAIAITDAKYLTARAVRERIASLGATTQEPSASKMLTICGQNQIA